MIPYSLLGLLLILAASFVRRTRDKYDDVSIAVALPVFLLGRRLAPNFADHFRSFYLIAAILLCTAVLLGDTFRQLKLRKALEPPSTLLT